MKLKLRELREARGLKVRQMYERLGVQDSRYRKWESGAAAIPLDYAIQCADILKCSLDELAGREFPKVPAAPSLSPDEQSIVTVYREADERGRRTINRAVSGVAEDMEFDAREKKAAI